MGRAGGWCVGVLVGVLVGNVSVGDNEISEIAYAFGLAVVGHSDVTTMFVLLLDLE